MYSRFESYLKQKCNAGSENKFILAVSGGIDSVVMLDLFSQTGYKCKIAHCNFHLRGSESDGDEKFVRDLENKYGIPVLVKNFDTRKYASDKGISIQMAARDLRYNWFRELTMDEGSLLVSAHNLGDQIETFFINLARGTGIRGLSGIKARNGDIIRPLLWAERELIEAYALKNDIKWREDSSNSSLKYTRNKIRHEVIPLFKSINPAFADTMQMNLKKLRDVEKIYLDEAEIKKRYLLIHEEDIWKINIPSLLKEKNYKIWLYEMLQEFGFSAGSVDDLCLSLMRHESGKIFYSDEYRLVKDREYLIIELKQDEEIRRYYIEEGQDKMDDPLPLEIQKIDISEFHLERSNTIAQLDFDKLHFPLIIRKWQAGDYFMPLGMQNLKKLSDFFIDQKMSIPEKEKTWIMTSGKHIVWVIGQRIDERFKVGKDTEMVVRIKLN